MRKESQPNASSIPPPLLPVLYRAHSVAGSYSLDETEAYFEQLEGKWLPAEAEEILKHQADLAIQQNDFFGNYFALRVASVCQGIDPELALRLLVFWAESGHPSIRPHGAKLARRFSKIDPQGFAETVEKILPVLAKPENSRNKRLITLLLLLGPKGIKKLKPEIRSQALASLGGWFREAGPQDLREGFRVLGRLTGLLADLHFTFALQLQLPPALAKDLEAAQVFLKPSQGLSQVFGSLPTSWNLLGSLPKHLRRTCISNFIQNATVFSLQQFAWNKNTHQSTVATVMNLLEAEDLDDPAVARVATRFFATSASIDLETPCLSPRKLYSWVPFSYPVLKSIQQDLRQDGPQNHRHFEAAKLISQAIFDGFGMENHGDLPDAHHCLAEGARVLKALKRWSQQADQPFLVSFLRFYRWIIKVVLSVLDCAAITSETLAALYSDLVALARIFPEFYGHVALWKMAQALFLDPEIVPADFSQWVTRLLASGDLTIGFVAPSPTLQPLSSLTLEN